MVKGGIMKDAELKSTKQALGYLDQFQELILQTVFEVIQHRDGAIGFEGDVSHAQTLCDGGLQILAHILDKHVPIQVSPKTGLLASKIRSEILKRIQSKKGSEGAKDWEKKLEVVLKKYKEVSIMCNEATDWICEECGGNLWTCRCVDKTKKKKKPSAESH